MAKKIMEKIQKLKRASAEFVYDDYIDFFKKGFEDDAWDSSAQNLEHALRKHGVIPSQKLYYEYKFPDGLQNFEIDKNTLFPRVLPVVYEGYLQQFDTVETKRDLYLDRKRGAKTDLSAFFGFCICLAFSDMKNLKSVFKRQYVQCMDLVLQMAEQIRELNPELQGISDYRNVDFVNGAIYGFAPQEIEYFIKLQERRKTRPIEYEIEGKDPEVNYIKVASAKISDFIQERVEYFLAPETCDILLKDIEKAKMRGFTGNIMAR